MHELFEQIILCVMTLSWFAGAALDKKKDLESEYGIRVFNTSELDRALVCTMGCAILFVIREVSDRLWDGSEDDLGRIVYMALDAIQIIFVAIITFSIPNDLNVYKSIWTIGLLAISAFLIYDMIEIGKELFLDNEVENTSDDPTHTCLVLSGSLKNNMNPINQAAFSITF